MEWSYYSNHVPVSDLIGKTIERINRDDNADEIRFYTDDAEYVMGHIQDCCEQVSIDDVIGDLDDLIGSSITMAEEVSNNDEPKQDDWDDSWTWTFYKFATAKGYVTIRWYGTSNGYYSESVDFIKKERKQHGGD